METRQYAIGDTITMQLMRREKGVLVALPKSQWMNVVQPVYIRGECISVLVVGILFLTVIRICVETVDPGCKTWGLAAEKLDDHILTINLLLTLLFYKGFNLCAVSLQVTELRLLPSQSLLMFDVSFVSCSHWCDSYCFYWLFSVLNIFPPDSLYSFTKITVSGSKLFQGCNLQQGFHHLHLSTEVSECYGEIIKIIANLIPNICCLTSSVFSS